MPPDASATSVQPLLVRIVRRWAILGIVLLLLSETTPYLPAMSNRWIDLPSHFALQYFIGAVAVLAAGRYARFGARCWSGAALALLVSLPPLVPYLPLQAAQPSAPALKLLQANVLFLNKDPRRFKTLIEKEKPDIVLIAEANNAFAKMLGGMRRAYPYQQILPDEVAADGIGVVSRLKLEHLKVLHWNDADMPALSFDVGWQGHSLHVIGLHTPNPVNDIKGRDATLAGLKKEVREARGAVIAAGDFNATPWCPALRALAAQLPQLHNARQGRGLFLSWPAFFPVFLRIPIDETLVSDEIAVQDYRLGPDIGSDHLPVISALSLREPK